MNEFLKGYHEVIPAIAPQHLAHDLGVLLGIFVAIGLIIIIVTFVGCFINWVTR